MTFFEPAEQPDSPLEEPVRGLTARSLTAAIEIYALWEERRRNLPADRIVDQEFRSRRYLNAGERRWIASAVYGSLRFLRRQERVLETLGLPVTPENRLRLWVTAPVQENGESAAADPARLPEPAIASPEALQAAVDALPGPESAEAYLRIALSFSDEMAQELETLLGPGAPLAGQAFNKQAPTTLRINTLRASRQRVRQNLPENTLTRYSPWGVELLQRANIPELPGFREGWFDVQEEASQIAVLLTDARPGQTVADVGAGGGGKTLALAVMMQNRGTLLAFDSSKARLEELKRRTQRAGVRIVDVCPVVLDETGRWQHTGHPTRTLEKIHATADCVLVDAPCTGSGVLRRSPDTKWRETDRGAVEQQQRVLLEQSAELAASGGSLIYVTCAFERWQNEAVVEAFLNSPAGQGFIVEDALPRLEAALQRLTPEAKRNKGHFAELVTGPFLRTWPHRHGMDAFFAACLRRK